MTGESLKTAVKRISIVLIIIGFMLSGFGVISGGLEKTDWSVFEKIINFPSARD